VETSKELDVLTFTLGLVGPASMADKTQKYVHELVGSGVPMGWGTQLGNELGVVATYQHSWRAAATTPLLGFEMDLTPYVGGALGVAPRVIINAIEAGAYFTPARLCRTISNR
jgi:hypothetical protein